MAEVLRVQDQITHVRGEAMTKELVSAAVAHGIKAAVSDPETWANAGAAIKQHAQREAGGWLFGSIRSAISKVFLFLLAGTLIYMIGGWSALVSFFKSAP